MNVALGIQDPNQMSITTELSKMLAEETVRYIKTKNAHWNIEGQEFNEKYKFFESLFGQLDEIFYSVAERIRTIGEYAPVTLKAYFGLTHLTEKTRALNDCYAFSKDHLMDHESIIMYLRENIKNFGNEHKDLSTSDFIAGLVETHEEMSWFLRSCGVK